MNEREQRLIDRGYPIERVPPAAGLYTPVVVSDGMFYLSGSVPMDGTEQTCRGKVPSEVGVEEATKAAALCAANLLRVFIRDVGPLSQIVRLVKVTGFVNSDPTFAEQHLVINGASQLFLDVLGEAGHHARSAVGMAGLPTGAAVEVELIGRMKASA